MDERILNAIANAAMLTREEAEALAQDLEKINGMMDKAARTSSAGAEICDTSAMSAMARFQNAVVMTAENSCDLLLREDPAKKCDADENYAALSDRYEAPYVTVPRVV